MKLIINIDEDDYEMCKIANEATSVRVRVSDNLRYAIANGIPLPKGHGRIADMDEAIKCIEDVTGDDAIYAIALIEWACGKRTIIEADTERSE